MDERQSLTSVHSSYTGACLFALGTSSLGRGSVPAGNNYTMGTSEESEQQNLITRARARCQTNSICTASPDSNKPHPGLVIQRVALTNSLRHTGTFSGLPGLSQGPAEAAVSPETCQEPVCRSIVKEEVEVIGFRSMRMRVCVCVCACICVELRGSSCQG